MKTLKETPVGATVTVRRITGGRALERKLEQMRIMAGSDLTVLELLPSDGSLRVDTGRGEQMLSLEDADHIGVGEPFIRKKDPILLGGCCAGGNLSGLLDRIEDAFEKPGE